MTKVLFKVGDRFSFGEEYGIVLGNDKALLFKGRGGRTGRTVKKGNIPNNAIPIIRDKDLPPYEVSFAMDAVAVVIKRS